MSTRQLTRSTTHRLLGGVAGGISEYTGIDCGIVRLITALVVILFPGFGPLLYIAAWIILPETGSSSSGLDKIIAAFKSRSNGDPNPNDLR